MKYFRLYITKTLRYTLKPLSFLPAVFMMYLIFHMSAQDGATSANLSYRVSHKLITIANAVLDKGWDALQIAYYSDRIHFYVRKLGHVTEYFALAASVAFPLYVYRLRGFKLVLIAGIFCVGFAFLDEYHQSFVAGRGPSLRDVGIDCIGIFAGIICVRIAGFIGRKTIFAPLAKQKIEK